MRFYLLVLVQTCLVSLSISESWPELETKLDAYAGWLEPSETLKLLETLEGRFKVGNDEESKRKHKRIKTLLHISEINKKKCEYYSLVTFKLIDEQLSLNVNHNNVLTFLKHYRDAQYEMCHETLFENLKEDVESLPSSFGSNLDNLKRSILRLNKLERNREDLLSGISRDMIRESIIDIIERQLGPFAERIGRIRDGEEVVKKEFDKLIQEPCNRLAGKKPLKIQEFKILSSEREIVKKFDPFVRSWLENYNLCLNMIGDQGDGLDLLRDSSSVLLRVRKQPKRKNRPYLPACLYVTGS